MGDIKYQLKKIGFPACVKEALDIIEQIILNRHSSVITTSLQLANEIISEFIFLERPLSNSKAKQLPARSLSSLEELELINILCNYFSCNTQADKSLTNAIFLCLFPSGDETRLSILIKLVSMVVSTKSKNVLDIIGTWLQQTGPTSGCALALAKSIVNDYLILVPEAQQHLYDLPHIAPEFATCFLCAVTTLHATRENIPPKALLETVAQWTKTSLPRCTAAITVNQVPVTPFLGLIRWCIMTPVFGAPECEEYSQLQLALLESFLHAPRERLITAEQLAAFVQEILDSIPLTTQERLQKTLDRFTQTVIVLLRTGTVVGNILNLFQQMDRLPKNELLEIMKGCRQELISAPHFRTVNRT